MNDLITKAELFALTGKENPIILDCGAFNGKDAYEFCELGAYVVAFEPLKSNFDKIPAHENLTALPYALGDKCERVKMWTTDNGCSGSLNPPKTHLDYWPQILFKQNRDVDVITLDSWYKGGVVDLIWADVNGNEAAMIRGATETLKNTRYLFIEVSDVELYEGQVNILAITKLLPGWTLMGYYNITKKFCDCLFRNDGKV